MRVRDARPPSRTRAFPVGAALVLAALVPARPAAAQEGCAFGEDGNDVLRQVTLSGGEVIYHVTRPHFVCEGGVQIWADSATAYTATDLAHLIGSVRYEEPGRALRADEARYFSNVGRLQASGNLVLRDLAGGTVVEHGDLVYFRRTDFRDEETMTVTTAADGTRPVATLVPGDSAPGDSLADPDTARTAYVVEGDEIALVDGSLRSTGDVRVRYDSVRAFADTLVHEEEGEAGETVRLFGRARIESRAYELAGRRIDLRTPAEGAREIVAREEATLVGEDLRLTAPVIHVFGDESRLERLVALSDAPRDTAPPAPDAPVPPPAPAGAPRPDSGTAPAEARPHAVAGAYEITADSLEVLAPGESLERIFAAGRARSVSRARDSVAVSAELPEVAQADWLEGDTIVVTFARADEVAIADPAPDGSPEESPEEESDVRVERIVAIREARSLYRMEPASAPESAAAGAGQPALHYVTGERITIVMRDGEVDRLEVQGQATGVHLEPLGVPAADPAPPGDAPAPDPVPAAPDTVPVAPDTVPAGPGGALAGSGEERR